MKATKQSISILAAIVLTPFAFADHHEGEHADHDHAKQVEKEGHDDHAGHEHAKKTAGPNGGRILTEVEPHAEFFVTAERRVQITFLDDHGKAIAPGEQTIKFVGGKRTAPVNLTFEKTATGFLSKEALPAGNNIPAVITITSGDEKALVRFNINLDDCPTCDFLEYACICDH